MLTITSFLVNIWLNKPYQLVISFGKWNTNKLLPGGPLTSVLVIIGGPGPFPAVGDGSEELKKPDSLRGIGRSIIAFKGHK